MNLITLKNFIINYFKNTKFYAIFLLKPLKKKYWNKPYPFPIQTERIVLVIKPNKEVMFNLKDEDFE